MKFIELPTGTSLNLEQVNRIYYDNSGFIVKFVFNEFTEDDHEIFLCSESRYINFVNYIKTHIYEICESKEKYD